MANLFQNLIGYIFSNDEQGLKADDKPLKYVAAGNGNFEVRDTQLMSVKRKIDAIPKLPNIVEGITLHVPKLPFDIFNTIVSFMKKIYEDEGTESTIMVFYNKEANTFKLWVPLQENSTAASNYKRDDDPEYTRMCKENMLVMVAHSHPWGSGGVSNSSPSPSGTDNNDEKEALLYMIVGNVKGVPTTYVSTCPGGNRMKLKFFDIFQNPLVTSDLNPKIAALLNSYVPETEIMKMFSETNASNIPNEWLARCKKKQYQYSKQTSWANSNYNTSVVRWKDDPAAQYKERMGHGYSSYYNRYDDYYGDAYYEAYEKFTDDETDLTGRYSSREEKELEMEYEKRLLGRDNTDIADEKLYEFGDALDAALDMDDIELAQLIFVLVREGKEGLIRACLKIEDEETSKKLPVGTGTGAKGGVHLSLQKKGKKKKGGK